VRNYRDYQHKMKSIVYPLEERVDEHDLLADKEKMSKYSSFDVNEFILKSANVASVRPKQHFESLKEFEKRNEPVLNELVAKKAGFESDASYAGGEIEMLKCLF